jgi:hypothetical protein
MQYKKKGINGLETSVKTTGIRPVDMPVDTLDFELSLGDDEMRSRDSRLKAFETQ